MERQIQGWLPLATGRCQGDEQAQLLCISYGQDFRRQRFLGGTWEAQGLVGFPIQGLMAFVHTFHLKLA